jgi:hypothetical protein
MTHSTHGTITLRFLSPRDREMRKTDKLSSSFQMATLYPLVRSLADVAAFLQEISLSASLSLNRPNSYGTQ